MPQAPHATDAATLPPITNTGSTRDDPHLAAALESYLELCRDGKRPDRAAFLKRHESIQSALAECLEGLEFVQSAVGAVSSGDEPARGVAASAANKSTQLGDFRLLREIGRGGMGVVFEADQISLGRRVALKVLPFAAALDPRQRQRFQVEAQAAACLHHTHIVPVFAVGCDRGTHYYAMQYIEGRTLSDVILEMKRVEQAPRDVLAPAVEDEGNSPDGGATSREDAASRADAEESPTGAASTVAAQSPAAAGTGSGSRVPGSGSITPGTSSSKRSRSFVRTVARLGVQGAEALEHAHTLGILHRDIKPSNLMVDTRGALWIADFGLARVQDDLNLTRTGDVMGTLRYMSPEQAQARHGIIDERTDIYALGATLYELLTLTPAFEGKDRNELMRKLVEEDPISPRRLNASVPRDLDTVIMKALAKEPSARYRSAQDMADDLNRFLDDQPIQARRPNVLAYVGKFVKRHRAFIGAVLGIGFLSLVVTMFFVLGAEKKAGIEKAAALRANRDLAASLARQRALMETTFDHLDGLSMNLMGRAAFGGLLKKEDYERAISFYETISKLSRDEPELRIMSARSDKRSGYFSMIIQSKAAEDLYRRAIVTLQQVTKDKPEVAEYQRELANVLDEFGNWLWMLKRTREAEPNLREAFEVGGKLADAYAGRADFVLAHVHSQLQHARRLNSVGRCSEADAIVQDLLKRARTTADKVADKSVSMEILGEIAKGLEGMDRREGAFEVFEMAMNLGVDAGDTARDFAWFLVSRPPGMPHHDPTRALALLASRSESGGGTNRERLTRALAHARLSEADAAAAELQGVPVPPAGDAMRSTIEALILHAQGKAEEAGAAYAKATAWREANRFAAGGDVVSLMKEAAARLGVQEAVQEKTARFEAPKSR